jgi:hypothetical protein
MLGRNISKSPMKHLIIQIKVFIVSGVKYSRQFLDLGTIILTYSGKILDFSLPITTKFENNNNEGKSKV